MADISILARLLNGATRNVDLTNNTPVVLSIKIGGGTNTELTKAILDKLVALQNGSDVDATYHTHDGRYYTETELSSTADGASGASKIGVDQTPAFSNFSGANVQAALESIDSALGTVADEKLKVSANDTTAGYLNGKLVAGTGISLTENNDASNETLTVASTITQYTDEMAQDAVGGILTDSASIDFTYDDVGNQISAAVIPGGVDHGALAGLGDDAHTIYVKADGTRAFSGNQSMGGNKITGLGAPTAASDAATKGYVDSALEGLKPKEAVRAATTANITLSGAQTIDGVSIVAGNRVLVKDQTLTENNGIYVAAAGAWSRATDFDSLSPIDEINKAYVAVQEGTTNAGKLYVQYGTVTTLDTDPINFTFFNSISGLIGGDGVTVSGSNISVDHDGEGLTFVATQLALELDGSSLSKGVSGVKVAAGGITGTELNASVAGAGLSGGGGSALAVNLEASNPSLQISSDELGVKFDPAGALSKGASGTKANVDNSTIEIATNALQVKAAGITGSHLNTSVAGDGLSGGGGSALAVNVDNSSIEIATDALQVKAAGITGSHLNTSVAGDGLTGGGGSALAVGANADGSIIVNANDVQVGFAPAVKATSEIAGEAFSATTLYAVRYGQDAETAGRIYKADKDASSVDNFYVIGLVKTSGALIAADTVPAITKVGLLTATTHGFTVGKPVFLDASGALTSTAPSLTNNAVVRVGMVKDANTIDVQIQVIGVN